MPKVSPNMKNAVNWDVAPCRSCVTRRFGGTHRLHLQSRKIIFFTLKMKTIHSSESSVHTRYTRRYIPEDGILHSHRRENLKSYKFRHVSKEKKDTWVKVTGFRRVCLTWVSAFSLLTTAFIHPVMTMMQCTTKQLPETAVILLTADHYTTSVFFATNSSLLFHVCTVFINHSTLRDINYKKHTKPRL
jgi:hypothetical protein